MTIDKIIITREEFFSKLNKIPITSYKVDYTDNYNYFILGDYKYCLKTELSPSIKETFWKIKNV